MILGFGILTSQLLQSKRETSSLVCSSDYISLYLICACRYVMSPPIREAGHGKALQAALSSGILQVIHLCHTLNHRVGQH
jgi:dihydroorotase-like cyclic amidohydrolase